ncbi:hypothetical protein X757_06420 [Mesorhizobium sp. LSHC414A00]|nr:hypothetical protein X757_06420 [Mesorhizobium sp. LSHC414A00]
MSDPPAESRDPAFERRSAHELAGQAMAAADYFPAARDCSRMPTIGRDAFPSRGKIADRRHPLLRSGPPLRCG